MNNFYFLNLNIPLFKKGITFHDIPKIFILKIEPEKYINEEMFDFFSSLNLKITFIETFFKTPKNLGAIHVDNVEGDHTKLNWTFGSTDSKMCWYKPISELYKPVSKTDIGTPYISYTRNQVIEIENTIIKNPTLVQVGIPHNIINVTENRLCVSIVFRNKITGLRPTMSESVEIFKNYITNDIE